MFKDKIKKLRETHNLTQEELAKKVTDIGDKRRLDRQKRDESIIRIFLVLLILSLTLGWFFFKKTEVMRYTADEAMMYGFKGISHDLDCASRQLIALRGNGYLEKADFARLCRDLERDMI